MSSDYRVVVTLPGEVRAGGGDYPLVEFRVDDDTAAVQEFARLMRKRNAETVGALTRHKGGPANADDSWEFVASRWGGPEAVVMLADGSVC